MYGRLMGLNRKQVDEYLENLNRSSQKQIESAKERIKQVLDENAKLQLLLEKLKSEKDTYLNQEKYIEPAKKRLKETISKLDKITNNEVADNMNSAKEKLSSYYIKLESTKKEIKNTRSNIDELFQRIKEVLEQEKKPEEEFDFSEDSRNNIKLVPFLSNQKLKASEEVKFDEASEEIKLDKASENQMEQTQKDSDIKWEPEAQKITADGLWVQDMDKVSENLVKQSKRDSEESEKSNKNNVKSEFERFWSDVEPDKAIKTDYTNVLGVSTKSAMNYTSPAINDLKTSNTPIFAQTDVDTRVSSSNIPLADSAAASPAVTKEIEFIKHRYIVGKLSGEDMYDSAGRLIISRNTVITPDIIVKAEMEGKLPDLIVNMIIPGI